MIINNPMQNHLVSIDSRTTGYALAQGIINGDLLDKAAKNMLAKAQNDRIRLADYIRANRDNDITHIFGDVLRDTADFLAEDLSKYDHNVHHKVLHRMAEALETAWVEEDEDKRFTALMDAVTLRHVLVYKPENSETYGSLLRSDDARRIAKVLESEEAAPVVQFIEDELRSHKGRFHDYREKSLAELADEVKRGIVIEDSGWTLLGKAEKRGTVTQLFYHLNNLRNENGQVKPEAEEDFATLQETARQLRAIVCHAPSESAIRKHGFLDRILRRQKEEIKDPIQREYNSRMVTHVTALCHAVGIEMPRQLSSDSVIRH